ncbi:hypothetical protein JCM16303_000030 [Sporobolomyces ruberrimus]
MFKFWKSPKSSSDPSKPSQVAKSPGGSTSTSVNNSVPIPPPTTGLGITTEHSTGTSPLFGENEGTIRVDGAEGRVQLLDARDGVAPPSTSGQPGSVQSTRGRISTTQAAVTFVNPTVDTEKVPLRVVQHSRTSVGTPRETMRNDRVQERSYSSAAERGPGRTASPLSFSPSVASTFQNPYGPSVAALTDRDPNQIYAPTTWSDMAHQELVVNLSTRERTRQEILWEVVASEERYVAELRSLVEHYTIPLLHPLLSASPHISSPPLTSMPFTRQSLPAASSSSAELPIASRFQRSTPSSVASSSFDHVPEIRLDEQEHRSASTSSSPPLLSATASAAQPLRSSFSTSKNSGVSGKLASFGFSRSRQRSSAPSKAFESTGEPVPPPPVLPGALRSVLEATIGMLKGHEELSAKLKEQWEKSFPLVRGLAATWSDQVSWAFGLDNLGVSTDALMSMKPWFLQTYAAYIVSLEESLSIIDSHLQSHPSASPSSRQHHGLFRSAQSKKQDRLDQGLTLYLEYLEREAGRNGESSLSICISKPLMRMAKLPLLMQALLFHTDPTTHEWEKTRAMALEVDALVRSIEDERIEEDQRERTRDVLARIDGINDRGLMMPRSSRLLLSEQPAPPPSSTSPPMRKPSMKRSSRRHSAGTQIATERWTKSDREWLISFTDVVIRARKVGETNVPGSFSREKEKQGKQGKTRKAGPVRNTYRFLRVEQWETSDRAEAALSEFRERDPDILEESDGESTVDYAESRMSFRYDSDEPQPINTRRDFSSPTKRNPKNVSTMNGRRSVSSPATDSAKFGGRLRLGSEDACRARSATPGNRHRFDSPTLSSTLKAQAIPATAAPQRISRSSPAAEPLTGNEPALPATHAHPRDESTYNLYKMWSSTQE